jgi:hypothetical protein
VSVSGREIADDAQALLPLSFDGSPFCLTAQDAARALGVTDRQARRLAEMGVLRGRRDPGGRWAFDRASVAAERERRDRERADVDAA